LAVGRSASSRSKGVEGERAAAQYLSSGGYELLARNFRSRSGEIDIIAERAGTVAFIEVKAWDAFGIADLEFSIGSTKKRRIMDTARLFLAERPWLAGKRMRFDVIFLSSGESGAQVRHIEGAF
jgi:putative endonuclease